MGLITLSIPAAFIMARAELSWRDLQFGFVKHLLDPQAVIDFAVEEVIRLERPPSALLDLAGSNRNEPVRDPVKRLASGEPERPEDELRDKWLYLTLAWLYDQRGTLPEPLQTVEDVYADFGYPEEIAGFVRYMPTDGPNLGSREANEQRLVERWKQYVDSTATRYMR